MFHADSRFNTVTLAESVESVEFELSHDFVQCINLQQIINKQLVNRH